MIPTFLPWIGGLAAVLTSLSYIPQVGKTQPRGSTERRIAMHSLPTRKLAAVVQRSIPALKYIEKVVHPRWHTPPEATKRLVGAAVVMLSATLVFIPIPLSNVVPALVIALISLAYLEEDGLLLAVPLLAAVVVLMIAVAAGWEMVVGANG